MPYKQEEIKPYNNEEEKGVQVEQMFDNIAHSTTDCHGTSTSFGETKPLKD